MTAIIRQVNTVDISRRSPSYEVRLAKYAERGFEIFIPSLSRNAINPAIYDRNLEYFPQELARLLVFERLYWHPNAYAHLKYPRTKVQIEDKVATTDEDPLEGATDNAAAIEKSFYESDLRWCRIPYDQFWNAQRIEAVILKKAIWLNGKQPSHSALTQITQLISEQRGGTELIKVKKRTSTFMVTNPGQHLLSGSFQPIDGDEWELRAYTPADAVPDCAQFIGTILQSITSFQDAAGGGGSR
ncbi:hypothetical protein CVT26_015139 [Gymnopilus dilepis]|uniref:Uncharacterized protein n=1 Tax=Gymnopilus dilepis TaxID=231916 RepID=A0A409YEX6_9AGAR|nr:hypothetical protein CVT26_015139 [Gymnopilus dilepis]